MKKIVRFLLLMTACLNFTVLQASGAGVDSIFDKQVSANKQAKISQEKIDRISDETRKLIDEYKQTVIQTDNYNTYNAHIKKMINSQIEEEMSLKKQLDSISQTELGIIPLMLKMLDALEIFIDLDMPFLLSERQARIEKIKNMMSLASVSTAEKYRRILEAYQIEMDYGRTIETYAGIVPQEKTKKAVNFIRFGRLIFMYQTLDESEAAVWDNDKKSWQFIPDEQKRELTRLIRIAKKQLPPDLLVLPVKSAGIKR